MLAAAAIYFKRAVGVETGAPSVQIHYREGF